MMAHQAFGRAVTASRLIQGRGEASFSLCLWGVLACACARADVTVSVEQFDSRFGDTVTISPEQESYAEGTEVTLTATLAGETVYKRWYGLPTNAVINTSSLVATEDAGTVTATFTVGTNALDILFHSAAKWTYLPDAPYGYYTNAVTVAEDGTATTNPVFVAWTTTETGIISNRIWQLNAHVQSAEDRWLTIGRQSGCNSGEGYTGIGNGALDLSGPIRTLPDANGSTEEWIINYPYDVVSAANYYNGCLARMTDASHAAANPRAAECYPTRFVIPETTECLPYRSFFSNGLTLTNCVLFSTNLVYMREQWLYDTSLQKVVWKTPALQHVQGDFSFDMSANDLSGIDLSSVTNIACLAGGVRNAAVRGTLRLPRLSVISAGYVFPSEAFRPKQAHPAYEFGTGYTPKDQVTLRITGREISSCFSFTSLTLGPYVNVTNVNANVTDSKKMFCDYFYTYAPKIVFQGAPLTDNTAVIDALIKGQTAASNTVKHVKKTVRIYGSAALGWGAVADTNLTAFEETEKAELAVELEASQRVLGVYAGALGERKAWIIHQPSPFDPKGIFLIVR